MKKNSIWNYLSLNVPLKKNREQKNINEYSDSVFCVRLDKDDYNALNDLFDTFNDKFSIIIDLFEDEILPNKYLEDAIFLTNEYIRKNPVYSKSGKKLLIALDKAVEECSCVEFCL